MLCVWGIVASAEDHSMIANDIAPEHLEKIPKDTIMLTWGYGAKDSFEPQIGGDHESIEKLVLSGQTGSDNLEIMVSTRQRSALERARQQVLDTRDGLREAPLDCLGVDLGGAMEALGEITGKNLKEEAIDRIFHDFCIGK